MASSPTLPPSLAKAWNIDASELIADTPSSLVFRVRRGADTQIVKSLKPAGRGELPGMDFLCWRQGNGAVQLIDRIGDACLLADGGTQTLREHLKVYGDETATAVVLRVLDGLHAPSDRPAPATLVPLERHFRSLFELAKTAWSPEIGDLSAWAAREALELVANQHAVRPLHGDLHHDNIIHNAFGEWRAIDPQGLYGDPVYDVANIYGNPLGEGELILDRKRIIRLTETFASHFDCRPSKVLRFAAVHAVLSAAWTLEDAATQSGEANLAERLAFARIARSLFVEQFVD